MEYKFKGTPAPWLVEATPKGKLKVTHGGFLVSMMYSGNGADKDAALISASPLLLQACIDALRYVGDNDRPLSKELKQAIHKALNIK